MPKEQINYPSVQRSVNPDGTSAPLGAETSIHWSGGPMAHAQIGFEFDVQSMLDYLNRLRKDSPTDSRAIFYTEELTRPDLQRMVRAGRRARDAVYGSDE